MLSRRQLLPGLLCGVAIAWLNVYLCRETFALAYTGHMHSMHGFWMALARMSDVHWLRPSWWPYWFGGMPFECTYAPLIPGSMAAYARLTGVSAAAAFQTVAGLVFCLEPVILYLLAWRFSRAPVWSLIAAAVYTLAAPTELLLPDGQFAWLHLADARRLYLAFVWDEVPHMAALALASLALIFLHLAFETRRRAYGVLAAACMVLTVLANPFGGVALAMELACYLAVYRAEDLRRSLAQALWLCAAAYLVASPFYPPSLLRAVRANANAYPESAWTGSSALALAAVLAFWLLLWRLSRNWQDRWLRFCLLVTCLAGSIPLLHAHLDVHFVPQPGRYKVEMGAAMALLAVFAARAAVQRVPLRVQAVLALALLWPATALTVRQRRYARQLLRPDGITQTIEYRVAQWVDRNLPGERVLAAGSLGQWMNAFAGAPQFTGGSFPTAWNPLQQTALYFIYETEQAGAAVLWLKAYGVRAVIVPGPQSPEFWKPFGQPRKFDPLLPVLWRERDTAVYRVPSRTASLAHVIPAGLDPARLERYVAALEDPALPVAGFAWQGDNRALIRTTASAGQNVSVQINHHPGWHARANGAAVPVLKDGLGQMLIEPRCQGPCEIELNYDGGWEAKLCRLASALTLLACAVALSITMRKGKS